MKPIYHIVSHSHWDREWYKSFEQFRVMLVNMVDDLLELLERDPAFACFTLDGQTVVLDDYLAVRPEQEQRIRALVAAGRLNIGPWYVLPDEFLVSGESTIRNLLTGIQRAQSFGGQMNVGYIPDSFGHIAMMPAILKGFNINTALVYRGFGGEPGQTSSEYRWHAPDGSQVLMIHLYKNGYSGGYFHGESDAAIVERFAVVKKELDERATTSHRLLLNGGDHHWPDPQLPGTLELLRRSFEGDFIHSNLPRYAEAVQREAGTLPDVAGELRFGYRYAFAVTGGVYSSRMYLKQQNWKQQTLLQRYVEPFSAFAAVSGMRSQRALVHHAWHTLMQNHPHDSICGCSIDTVHREMVTRFKAVEDSGTSVLEGALNHLIPEDDLAAGDDRYLFFVNPSPMPRTGVAEAEVNFYLQDIVVGLNPDVTVAPKLQPVGGFTLHDEAGKEIPYQIANRSEGYDITYTRYNYPKQTYADKLKILVDPGVIPAMGYKGVTVRNGKRFPTYASRLKTGPRFLENDALRVDVSGNGQITVTDKERGHVYDHLHVFEDGGDVGDEYNYSYPAKDKVITSRGLRAKVTRVEKGPLRGVLQITMTLRVPEAAAPSMTRRSPRLVPLAITSKVYLTAHSRSVEIETTVENIAKDHRLRVLFPTGIATNKAFADSQFCIVEREQQEYDPREFSIEVPARVAPMQRFVTVRGEKNGASLLAYGLPEYELKTDGQGTLALTLLRCIGQLAGERLLTRPGGKSGWHNETPDAQCQGTHSFRYAFYPHGVGESDMMAGLNLVSEEFHQPLRALRRKNPGELHLERSFLSLSDGRLVLSAVKEPEQGEGLVVRVYNPASVPVQAQLRWALPLPRAYQTTLQEGKIRELPVNSNSEIVLNVLPRSIETILLTT